MLRIATHTEEDRCMSMEDSIIRLFCIVDDALKDVKRHDQALLHPSEIVFERGDYVIKLVKKESG
jgi:hypothetical protein